MDITRWIDCWILTNGLQLDNWLERHSGKTVPSLSKKLQEKILCPSISPDFVWKNKLVTTEQLIDGYEGAKFIWKVKFCTIGSSNEIQIGKRYCLSNPETYSSLNLPQMSSIEAAMSGFVKLLENEYQKFGVESFNFKYVSPQLGQASKYGHIDVLDWWWQMCQKENKNFMYDEYTIDQASGNGNLDVLEWWWNLYQKHDLKFKHSLFGIDEAAQNNHLHVLKWLWQRHNRENLLFKKNGAFKMVSFKFTKRTIDMVAEQGNLDILKWWWNLCQENSHHLKFTYSNDFIESASYYGRLNIIQWWWNLCQQKKNHLKFKYSCKAVDEATSGGHLKVLDWWLDMSKNNHFKFKFSLDSLSSAVSWFQTFGDIQPLVWWETRLKEKPLRIDQTDLNGCDSNFVEWLLQKDGQLVHIQK